jgi:hypothetical protein
MTTPTVRSAPIFDLGAKKQDHPNGGTLYIEPIDESDLAVVSTALFGGEFERDPLRNNEIVRNGTGNPLRKYDPLKQRNDSRALALKKLHRIENFDLGLGVMYAFSKRESDGKWIAIDENGNQLEQIRVGEKLVDAVRAVELLIDLPSKDVVERKLPLDDKGVRYVGAPGQVKTFTFEIVTEPVEEPLHEWIGRRATKLREEILKNF